MASSTSARGAGGHHVRDRLPLQHNYRIDASRIAVLGHSIGVYLALLFMDESTDHLDMTSTQVMKRALQNFSGAVVVASHDQFIIGKIAT